MFYMAIFMPASSQVKLDDEFRDALIASMMSIVYS